MRAIGLVRVSTSMQADTGVSLDAQAAKIRSYCAMMDLDLIDIVVEAGKSGKNANREGLQEALTRIDTGEAQALVVYSLSRLSRRVVDTLSIIERIENADASFHSISEKVDTASAVGRFFVTLVSALASLEREQLAERTSMALRHVQAEGRHVGRVPFGHEIASDGKLVARDQEAAIIERIVTLRASGATLRAIADDLNRHAIPTQKGRKWHARTVLNVIDREKAS